MAMVALTVGQANSPFRVKDQANRIYSTQQQTTSSSNL